MKNTNSTAEPIKQKIDKPQQKFIEDLLEEDVIDVCAVLDAKFKTPTQTWLKYNLFKFWVKLKELKQKLNFF